MEKVTTDEEKRRKVWRRVLRWKWDTPDSYIDEVLSTYTTDKKKTKDLADVYVNIHPEPSWERLVKDLYRNGEVTAAKEARSFLQNKDEPTNGEFW